MSAILVTGGAGFIGSHLCDRLIKDGREVVCLDVFDNFYDKQIKLRNIDSMKEVDRYHLYEGDIRNPSVLEDLFGHHSIGAVVHLAARAGVRPSLEMPRLYSDVNVTGTASLLEHCKAFNVKRFVFGSSSSVYGNSVAETFSESVPADEPVSPYAASKRAGELLCYTYSQLYGFDVACLRLFTVYGPRQRPEMAIHKFVRFVDEGETVTLYGDGSSARDYTFVTDIVEGMVAAVEKTRGFEIFNLGRGEVISLKMLVETIESKLGKKAKISYKPDQPGDVRRTRADLTKVNRFLGYEPRVSVEEGVGRFVDWYQEQKKSGKQR